MLNLELRDMLSGALNEKVQLKVQVSKMQERMGELNVSLTDKEKQLQELVESSKIKDEELAQLNALKVKQEEEISQQRRVIDELDSTNQNLKAQISQLSAAEPTEKEKGLEESKLQSRLKETREALAKKNELVNALQKNIDSLNKQLARKEEERKLIETRLTEILETMKTTAAQESAKQETEELKRKVKVMLEPTN
jgi:exonuclease SbcC